MAKYILDTRLKYHHYVMCTEAIRLGIIRPDDLNEGLRTMAEQWHFYRNQPPLAAFPSPNAPHIKVGRKNHDLDVNSWNGAAKRLAAFYEKHGINVSFCVGGESWHICVHSQEELVRAVRKILLERDRMISKYGESEPRISFFKFQLHYIKDPDTGRAYFKPGESRPEDGWSDVFNEELRDAVVKFQRDHGLHPDGKIGPQTDRKIDQVYARSKLRKRRSAKVRAQERKTKVLRGEEL